jgi:hypothetical protein
LNPSKLISSESGIESFKVQIGKYTKEEAKTHTKFDRFVDKIKTRYDRDC